MSSEGAPRLGDSDLERLFEALSRGKIDLSSSDLPLLSAPPPEVRARLAAVLRDLDEVARFALLERLIELADEHPTLDYSSICLDCLDDAAAEVRALAACGLSEYEGRDGLLKLVALVQHDPDTGVRTEVANALRPFAERAEFERLNPADTALVTDALRSVAENGIEEPAVRAAAMESLAVICQQWVRDLIHDAFSAGEPLARRSALRAMASSADDYWLPTVLDALASEDEEERVAAAIAAKEIADEEAVPALHDLLADDDPEVFQAAVAALAEIGGPAANDALQAYRTHPDAEVRATVQAALDLAAFVDDPLGLASGRI